jgi:hypothetical protein
LSLDDQTRIGFHEPHLLNPDSLIVFDKNKIRRKSNDNIKTPTSLYSAQNNINVILPSNTLSSFSTGTTKTTTFSHNQISQFVFPDASQQHDSNKPQYSINNNNSNNEIKYDQYEVESKNNTFSTYGNNVSDVIIHDNNTNSDVLPSPLKKRSFIIRQLTSNSNDTPIGSFFRIFEHLNI